MVVEGCGRTFGSSRDVSMARIAVYLSGTENTGMVLGYKRPELHRVFSPYISGHHSFRAVLGGLGHQYDVFAVEALSNIVVWEPFEAFSRPLASSVSVPTIATTAGADSGRRLD